MEHLQDVLDSKTIELIEKAGRTPQDPDGIERENKEIIEHLAPIVDELFRLYFRFDVEGIDGVPPGKALLVMNHEAGITFVQTIGMGARWYLQRGTDDRIMAMMHDAMFSLPFLGNLLATFGAVRASPANAERILAAGHKVLVAPGGNLEAFRSFSERHTIKFGGHKGWARIALKTGAPVVPLVFIGGHETFFVLNDGRELVRLLGLKSLLRIDTFPLFLGLPWGVGIGPLFHLPLPSKCSVRFLDPVPVEPASPDDEAAVEDLYVRVASKMQVALYEMGERRVVPVLG